MIEWTDCIGFESPNFVIFLYLILWQHVTWTQTWPSLRKPLRATESNKPQQHQSSTNINDNNNLRHLWNVSILPIMHFKVFIKQSDQGIADSSRISNTRRPPTKSLKRLDRLGIYQYHKAIIAQAVSCPRTNS